MKKILIPLVVLLLAGCITNRKCNQRCDAKLRDLTNTCTSSIRAVGQECLVTIDRVRTQAKAPAPAPKVAVPQMFSVKKTVAPVAQPKVEIFPAKQKMPSLWKFPLILKTKAASGK